MQNVNSMTLNKMMQSKPLVPGLAKPVSPLALGTAFYRYEEKQRWFELLDEFVGLGGTLLDSGRHYGTSERVIGEWMASRGTRDRVVLITKCGHGNCELPADNFCNLINRGIQVAYNTHLKILPDITQEMIDEGCFS